MFFVPAQLDFSCIFRVRLVRNGPGQFLGSRAHGDGALQHAVAIWFNQRFCVLVFYSRVPKQTNQKKMLARKICANPQILSSLRKCR